MAAFTTPFRERYLFSRDLDLQAQVEECADYLQHPDVLITEFLESYYRVEAELDPEREDALLETSRGELVLEPFYDSQELFVRRRGRPDEPIRCLGGAFDPLPEAQHPALDHQGLDYMGLRSSGRRVLGVTTTPEKQSAYVLMLRALNCLAEITPPFQLARLAKHVLRGRAEADVPLDLQLGLPQGERSSLHTALVVLTRDLAEIFKAGLAAQPQFADTLGRIECLEFEAQNAAEGRLRLRWVA